MRNLTDEQKLFFEALEKIQYSTVCITLIEHKNSTNLEEILLDATYEAIYRTMELFDGYIEDDLQFEIISKITKKSLRDSIELHDTCVDYLKHSE